MIQYGVTVGGRFIVESVVGSGGMGSIYRATDLGTGSHVALKVLRDERGDIARFERESRVLAQLDHPAVVRYVAHGVDSEGAPWLAMEWLSGEDLAARLAHEPLTLVESLTLCARVAQGLAAAHAHSIVHRDVKPSNLLLVHGDPSRVKVLDFGIARRTQRATRAATGTGMLLGTPGYMSPEQARGDRDLDARADLYALGCVLFECVTGAPVFRAENPLALLASVLLADPPRLRDVMTDAPEALDAILASLLAKHPAQRPSDAAAVAEALLEIARGESDAVVRRAPERPSLTLSTGERRVLCVVLAVDPAALVAESAPHDVEGSPTVSLGPDAALRGQLDALRARHLGHDGRVEFLLDGTVVFASQGATSAETARASRLALALRDLMPGRVVVLAAGHGTSASRSPLGAVLERAVSLARHRSPSVMVDGNAAALLHDRCRLQPTPWGALLLGEHTDDARMLLGVRTPFVGRERELALLGATFAECASDEVARAILVTAGAGEGKSRLRREFLAGLAERDEPPRVWLARADVLAEDSPLAPIRALVRGAAGLTHAALPEVERAALASLASRYCADDRRAARFLCALAGTDPGDGADPALLAAQQDPQLMSEQLRAAFVRLLAGACASGPLVLVLDDAHWCDGASLLFVDHALSALQERPLMVVAFARPEVRERFPTLWSAHNLQELRISPLSRRACERLVQSVLGEVPPERRAWLIERARGNAFYLEELLRAVASGAEAVPETVLAVVQARMSALSPEARRALRAAAVFGEACWSAGVDALLATTDQPQRSEAMLDELCAREALTRAAVSRFSGSVEYRFLHGLIHAACYATLTPEDRALGHALAGEWLRRVGESDPVVLAHHSEAAGERLAAARYLLAAGESALAVNNGDAASAHADHAERLAGGDETVINDAEHLRVRAEFYASRYASAVRRALALMARTTPESPQWAAVATIAATSMGRSRLSAQLHAIESALASAAPAAIHPAADRARAALAMEFFLAGEVPRGDAQLAAVQRSVEALIESDPSTACMLLGARGARAAVVGRLFTHVEEMERAHAIALRMGDRFAVASFYGSISHTLVLLGQHERCERHFAEALAYCTEVGTAGQRARVVLARASFRLAAGRFVEAIADAREAEVGLARASEERRLDHARYVVVRGLLETGEIAEAERVLGDLGAGVDRAPALRLARAQLFARTGRAREGYAEAMDAWASLGGHLLIFRCFGALTAHEAALGMGDRDAAREALRRGRAELDLLAVDSPDDDARDRFLHGVVDHARLVTLHAASDLSA